jgi:hypothetical protein
LGDYGVIDEETRTRERGNIFIDELLRSIIPTRTDEVWKPRTSEQDKLVITNNGEMTDVITSTEYPIRDAQLRLQFKGAEPGEFLAMYRP